MYSNHVIIEDFKKLQMNPNDLKFLFLNEITWKLFKDIGFFQNIMNLPIEDTNKNGKKLKIFYQHSGVIHPDFLGKISGSKIFQEENEIFPEKFKDVDLIMMMTINNFGSRFAYKCWPNLRLFNKINYIDFEMEDGSRPLEKYVNGNFESAYFQGLYKGDLDFMNEEWAVSS